LNVIPQLDVQALSAARTAGRPLIMLDVRESWEFETARIDGSINVPMSKLSMSVSDVLALKSEAGADADMVVICHHGVRSMACAQYLAGQGVRGLLNLRGGIDAWSSAVDPSVPRY
jgi:rhodanese-related sulfurtransferase